MVTYRCNLRLDYYCYFIVTADNIFIKISKNIDEYDYEIPNKSLYDLTMIFLSEKPELRVYSDVDNFWMSFDIDRGYINLNKYLSRDDLNSRVKSLFSQ